MAHCCKSRHYYFGILKCGSLNCNICKVPRLPQEVFSTLHHLPDPILGEEAHFVPFESVYGTDTTEKDRPSAQKSRDGGRKYTLKHVKNANLMLQCDDCSLWRLLYASNKLTLEDRKRVQAELDNASFTCGSPIEDLGTDLPVYSQALHCCEPIEKQYFSAGYEPICVYCASCEDLHKTDDYLPQCGHCVSRGQTQIKK